MQMHLLPAGGFPWGPSECFPMIQIVATLWRLFHCRRCAPRLFRNARVDATRHEESGNPLPTVRRNPTVAGDLAHGRLPILWRFGNAQPQGGSGKQVSRRPSRRLRKSDARQRADPGWWGRLP
jgi:hypothetical protein